MPLELTRPLAVFRNLPCPFKRYEVVGYNLVRGELLMEPNSSLDVRYLRGILVFPEMLWSSLIRSARVSGHFSSTCRSMGREGAAAIVRMDIRQYAACPIRKCKSPGSLTRVLLNSIYYFVCASPSEDEVTHLGCFLPPGLIKAWFILVLLGLFTLARTHSEQENYY